MLHSTMKEIFFDSSVSCIARLKNMRERQTPLAFAIKNLSYSLFYLAIYWALGSLSFLYSFDRIDIAPWNPAIAASIILLLTRGLLWSPLLFVAFFSYRLFFEQLDAPIGIHALTAAYEVIIYTAAVWLMKRQFKIDLSFGSLRDVVVFSTIITLAAGCMAGSYVLTYYFAGTVSLKEVLPLMAEYWAGDSLSILILIPFFLLNLRPVKITIWVRELLTLESFYQLSCVASLLFCVFWLQKQGIFIFYTLFIPVVWVAVRNGLSRLPVVLFITQSGIVLCSWQMNVDPSIAFKFLPFIMLVITWTGLILGSVTDERERIKLSNIKSDARLKAILDMAPDSMMIVDMQGHVVTANKNFTRMYGIQTSQQITGTSIEKIIPAFYPEMHGETHTTLHLRPH